jgi:ubiquinone/menaquinone biosynthesis C-methylase UbiE
VQTEAKLTANVFDEMGTYWSEIADRSQTERQIQFLKSQLQPYGAVLDVACGTGRHLALLSSLGFEVVGLDVGAKLLGIAKQRYRKAQVVRADMGFLPFRAEAFATAISMDTSLGYSPSENDDKQGLTELSKVLWKGGVLVVDVFNPEHLKRKYTQRDFLKRLKWVGLPLLLNLHTRWLLFRVFKWKEFLNFFLLQKRTLACNGGLLNDLWVVWEKATEKISVFEHFVRLYNYKTLQDLLIAAGFSLRAVYGDYDGQEFSANSPRLTIIAKRYEPDFQ